VAQHAAPLLANIKVYGLFVQRAWPLDACIATLGDP
jgi:hypothetical protein